MSNGPATFAIDDQKSFEDNLNAFAIELSAADADLASVLIPRLAEWSRNKSLEHTALWTDLLKAAEAPAQ